MKSDVTCPTADPYQTTFRKADGKPIARTPANTILPNGVPSHPFLSV